jgi:FKBP-type peptidyl-prolyl cis-trans isomerase
MQNKFLLIMLVVLIGIIGVLYFISSSKSQTTMAKNNSAKKGSANVTTTPDGLIIEDIVVGTGRQVYANDTVKINYRGTFTDGKEFDSSYKRNEPFVTPIGVGQVIKGWDEGVVGMKVGGKRKLTIPPALAYGSQGIGSVIPPNATLIFEVELLGIQ